MTSPIETRIAGRDVTLAVRTWGSPAPGRAPIVLVHGYPDTSTVWDGVATRLAATHRVIAYDVRGAGGSTASRHAGGHALEHLVADLAAVIDATSPGVPVHLVGHDWGGIQGWEAASGDALGGRIASFTTIAGPCLDHAGWWVRDRLRTPSWRGAAELAGQAARSWYVAAFHLPVLAPLAWRAGLGRAWPVALAVVEGVTAPAGSSATRAADAARGVELYRANVRARLARPRERRCDVPVLVIVPLRDHFVHPRLAEASARWTPQLRRRTIDAGHWVPLSHPDLIARWIEEHVAQAR